MEVTRRLTFLPFLLLAVNVVSFDPKRCPLGMATCSAGWELSEPEILKPKVSPEVPQQLREHAAKFRLICEPSQRRFALNQPIEVFLGIERVDDVPGNVANSRAKLSNPFSEESFPAHLRVAVFTAEGRFEAWLPSDRAADADESKGAGKETSVGLLAGERRGRHCVLANPGELTVGVHQLMLIATGEFYAPGTTLDQYDEIIRSRASIGIGGTALAGEDDRKKWAGAELDRSPTVAIEVVREGEIECEPQLPERPEVQIKAVLEIIQQQVVVHETDERNVSWEIRLTVTNLSTSTPVMLVDPFRASPNAGKQLINWSLRRPGREKPDWIGVPIMSRPGHNREDFVFLPPRGTASGLVRVTRWHVDPGQHEIGVNLNRGIIADPTIIKSIIRNPQQSYLKVDEARDLPVDAIHPDSVTSIRTYVP